MERQTKEPGRHCAFCLVFIPPEKVRCCSGCRRRAYCSRDCQVQDWSRGKQGQVHKNWCKLGCGEEDIDWEVVPVEGKGLGIIAKRFIPAEFQVMVDPIRSKFHPGVMDLMPLNGSIQEKMELNSFSGGLGSLAVCLRIARANHDCHNNVEFSQDDTFKVGILFATRNIQEGEEICVSYISFTDVRNEMSPKMASMILRSMWGIDCKKTCLCRNPEIEELVKKVRMLKSSITSLENAGRSAEALEQVEQLLELQSTLPANFGSKFNTLETGYHLSMLEGRSTLHKAEDYIKQLYDMDSKILASPNSEQALSYKELQTKVATLSNTLQNNPLARSMWKSVKFEADQRNSAIASERQTQAKMFLAYKSHPGELSSINFIGLSSCLPPN